MVVPLNSQDHYYRKELLSRVARRTQLEEAEQASKQAHAVGPKQVTRREKDDLINNRRSRFVDPSLVPPSRDKNDIFNIIREAKKERSEKEDKKKEKKSLSIFAKSSDLSAGDNDLSNAEKRKRAAFLRGEQVSYGRGRLTSSHNMKGSIEYPFEFVSDSYLPDLAAN